MCETAADRGDDRLGLLPDELLWRVLSFLPGDEALQTCVLDTRWRDLWRRTTSLLLVFDERSAFPSCKRFERLAKLIIHLRGNSPLVKCEINAYPDDTPEETFTNTRLLIDYAVTCQAEELVFGAAEMDDPPVFDVPLSLISQHLKTIHLERVNLDHSALQFSGCPVLEELRIQLCRIYALEISSKSLKRLCITDYCSLPGISRLRIYAPGLVSLQLEDFGGLTPFLEIMPLLETAYVRLSDGCHDSCRIKRGVCDNICCGCHAYPVNEGVLLNGLSNVVNLELIALPKMQFFQFIYRWDLKLCPVFGKLKTLLLNDWFTAIDLVCILQHSPVLEMLTLQFDNTENTAGATGAQVTIEQSPVCVHLKSVNIECEEVDEGVREILNILSTCGIPREQISIKDPWWL